MADKLLQAFGEIRIELDEFIPIDESILVVTADFHAVGRRAGTPVHLRVAPVVTMRDGLPARMAIYESKADALRAAADLLEAEGLPE